MSLTINCKGNLIDLSTPKVMGILNITPDSFYDGGKYTTEKSILDQVERMLTEGATFIDIGAYSSRPGADHISESEELDRLLPVIQSLNDNFSELLLSVDTFRSGVAKKAIEAGACMINDISGGDLDAAMFKTVAELQVPYCLMHMLGTPQTMQDHPSYEDIVVELTRHFSEKIQRLRALKVNDLIIDVGFGFGKTLEHNYELLNNLDHFQILEAPILSGLSRKSMLYKVLEISPSEALNASTVAHTIALLKGSNILRVHDVKEAVEAVKIVGALNR